MPDVSAGSSIVHDALLGSLAASSSGIKNAGSKAKTGAAGKSLFSRLLGEKKAPPEVDESEELDERLYGLSNDEAVGLLLDDIHLAGAALKERPFPDEIKLYKKAVRGFMQFVLKRSFDIERKRKSPLKVDFRIQITIIDQKLERMAAEILSGQLTQLGILERTGEIRGMLVDMLR
jgi:uncharacterized protein YaaR (DUF327 family)